ncbi:MAG: indolepyruvate oxidoreductase subunit beta family protein [Anaerolineae bacterium]
MSGSSTLTVRSVIISAIGGQGGNLLAEWTFLAAHLAGHRAQSIGMPGLAQRGGATTYYLEIASSDDPARLAQAVFSAFPFPGETDVLVAQEYLEMGRMLQRGFGAPDRTTVVASTHRDLAVFEKMPMGSGVVDAADLEKLAREFSRQFIGLDVPGVVRTGALNELSGNAVLLGALAASQALPITVEQYAEAIRRVGVAADANLKAFEAGLAAARDPGSLSVVSHPEAIDPIGTRAARLPSRQQNAYRALAETLAQTYNPDLVETLLEASYQLADYQDVGYAEAYLDQVEEVYSLDRELAPANGARLTETYARHLATLMTYEDAVRVADLKTRQARFDRIKGQLGVQPGQPYKVVDFLKPDMEEIYGIFPTWLADPTVRIFGRWFHDAEGEPRYWSQTPDATTLPGYMTFVFLTWFKPRRRSSWRYRKESAFWGEYTSHVREFARTNYDLGCLVAATGQMVRGYGHVRRRTFETTRRYLDNVVRPVMALPGEPEQGYRLTLRTAEAAKKVVLADDNGIDLAELLAQRIRDRHGDLDYDQLIAEVERSATVLKQTVPISMRKVAL